MNIDVKEKESVKITKSLQRNVLRILSFKTIYKP